MSSGSQTDQLLLIMGKKIGVTSPATQCKAQELHRRLTARGVKGLTATAEVVICLQLAATLCHETFDKDACVKLSGLTAIKYRSQVQAIALMLGLNLHLTIHDLAVTHSVLAAEKLALDILKAYETEGYGVDVSLPIYQTTALVAACVQLKLKLNKRRLLESCGINKKTFDKLLEVLTSLASKIHIKDGNKTTEGDRKRQKTLMELIEDNMANDAEDHVASKQQKCDKDQDNDDFEEWKRKILLEAQLKMKCNPTEL
ncbi:origin recognition complex subunit 6 isoform X2 [Hyalella azteca]|uniref:Origin recognition complex subunit 6 isoform X2 n=1 Tax=Hyalella azteca TaxID=294128 RepID=A0A8B7P5C2_HYAAZ|nr:origin recognition complex subunit 6 isoform X2 [Hyalella azteca]